VLGTPLLTAILDQRDAIAADGSQHFCRASGKIGSNTAHGPFFRFCRLAVDGLMAPARNAVDSATHKGNRPSGWPQEQIFPIVLQLLQGRPSQLLQCIIISPLMCTTRTTANAGKCPLPVEADTGVLEAKSQVDPKAPFARTAARLRIQAACSRQQMACGSVFIGARSRSAVPASNLTSGTWKPRRYRDG
jgi:hypothetical protein